MDSKTIDSERELLDCPFCGGKPELSEPIMIGEAYHTIRCKDCRITTARFSNIDKLAEVWNKRANKAKEKAGRAASD